MKHVQRIMLTLVAASVVSGITWAQAPAGEVVQQAPVIEGVERPDSPAADQAQGNAEAQMPRVAPGSSVVQPPVEVPPAPKQPPVQQD